MSWYRWTNVALNAVYSLALKTVSKNPTRDSLMSTTPGGLNKKGSCFSVSPCRAEHDLTIRRYYHANRRQIQKFNWQPRNPEWWYKNPRYIVIATIVGSGVLTTIYLRHLETIPYTNRTHLVLLSKNLEKRLGQSEFREIKTSLKQKILPLKHPDSVRIRSITKNITDALERGLSKEQVWRDPDDGSGFDVGGSTESLTDLSGSGESKKKKKKSGLKSATGHLVGMKWEVLVVDKPVVNAFCLPGGKIVVYTGLIKQFSSDAEIATIIGHEVGHVVARHAAEGITTFLGVLIIQLVLSQYIDPDIADKLSNLVLTLPFSRRMEIEADHIGVLLMASAGYDPRVAPTVFRKLGGASGFEEYLSTHPSGRRRARLLSQAKVMEEALLLYRESSAGRGIEGFL